MCQAQKGADAGILQGSYGQAAPQQNRFEPPRNPRAKTALRIKEEPSARVPSFSVCVLARQRNHGPTSFIRQLGNPASNGLLLFTSKQGDHLAAQFAEAFQR